MTGDDIPGAQRDRKATLAGRFGVAGLVLFGSVARDDASADGDIDLLVWFDGPAMSKRYFGTQFHIEDLLGRSVGPLTYDVLHTALHSRSSVRRSVSDASDRSREQ